MNLVNKDLGFHIDPNKGSDSLNKHESPLQRVVSVEIDNSHVMYRIFGLIAPDLKRQEVCRRKERMIADARCVAAILAKDSMLNDSEIDSVTGLQNRSVFERDLASVVSRHSDEKEPNVAISIIDLMGLKRVNDEYGQSEGDKYLRVTAGVIKSGLRRIGDKAYRIGGDELGLIRTGVNPDTLQLIDDRTKDQVQEALTYSDRLFTGIYIGSHLLRTGEDVETVYGLASAALKSQKEAFKATLPASVLALDDRIITKPQS